MDSNWHKKNSEKSDLIRLSYPPFTRIIKISDLQFNQKNTFSIRLNDQETANLIKFLGITNIFSFNCKINFKPVQDGWLILGIINLVASQQCVITLDNVRTKLKISLKRMLISEANIKHKETASPDLDLEDIDQITEILELGDIITEEIILMLPKYPRKKGVKLENHYTDSKNNIKPHPFQGLANLKQDLEKINLPKK